MSMLDSNRPGVPGTPASDMQDVLNEMALLHIKPFENLSPQEARRQPSPTDAVKSLLRKDGKNPDDSMGVTTADIHIPGPAGTIEARVYAAGGDKDAKPVVVYWHGGGWVIADLDVYDPTPRALAKALGCIVVSCHYRQAPEHKFPAAHEDAWAAYQWVLRNASSFGGDPGRVAVMGESAGGNLAANVAIMARDEGEQEPLHQVLVYPIAGNDMNSPSYLENAAAKPLGKAGMAWFVGHVFDDPSQTADPRINLVAANLRDLPPTTIVAAEIDPLRSEGKLLADRLEAAGTEVDYSCHEGVTHEFFGMGLWVKDAKTAEAHVAARLKAAFGTEAVLDKLKNAVS
jgi:acetyl esterase/lipase